MGKQIVSMVVCRWCLVTSLALLVSGCKPGETELSLTDLPQSGTFYVEPGWPHHFVVDANGDGLRMPDGLRIILESATFDQQVEPLLSSPASGSLPLQVDASYQLKKKSVVIGVVEGEDGGGSEKSRTYWVVELHKVRSVF